MRDILAFLGVVLLGLVIWFFFDYTSLIKAANSAHRAYLLKVVQNELKDPSTTEIDGKSYIVIPTK